VLGIVTVSSAEPGRRVATRGAATLSRGGGSLCRRRRCVGATGASRQRRRGLSWRGLHGPQLAWGPNLGWGRGLEGGQEQVMHELALETGAPVGWGGREGGWVACSHFLVLSSCSQFSRNSPNVFREPRGTAGNSRAGRMRVLERVGALAQAQRAGAVPRCSLLQGLLQSGTPKRFLGHHICLERPSSRNLERRALFFVVVTGLARSVIHPQRGREGLPNCRPLHVFFNGNRPVYSFLRFFRCQHTKKSVF
jgi:hypothetical protein